jgi:hypothetical protein
MKEKGMPEVIQENKGMPDSGIQEKKTPSRKIKAKELPKVGNPANTVLIGENMVEIKPTKLKYHRNNVAAFYKIVDMVPLPDILSMGKQAFGDGRDGDKALMDWLIAVFDDEQLVIDNYNDMDTGTIEKILAIIKRVNKIDEKEEKQKNAESRMKEA